MAKKRKSIFDTPTSATEIQSVAQKVQSESIDEIPKKNDTSSPPEKPEIKEKPMHLYVDKYHHQQSKINAGLRNMKLGEYIQWLIAQDMKQLKR